MFAMAALAVAVHVSLMLAGFVSGLVVAAVGEPRRVAKQLFAVTEGFFGPLFFVWLGAGLDLRDLVDHPSMVGARALPRASGPCWPTWWPCRCASPRRTPCWPAPSSAYPSPPPPSAPARVLEPARVGPGARRAADRAGGRSPHRRAPWRVVPGMPWVHDCVWPALTVPTSIAAVGVSRHRSRRPTPSRARSTRSRARWRRPDLRNHRKILVVDGRVAFTGSQNLIEPGYNKPKNHEPGRAVGRADDPGRGPGRRRAERPSSLTDWYSETDEILRRTMRRLDPARARTGSATCRPGRARAGPVSRPRTTCACSPPSSTARSAGSRSPAPTSCPTSRCCTPSPPRPARGRRRAVRQRGRRPVHSGCPAGCRRGWLGFRGGVTPRALPPLPAGDLRRGHRPGPRDRAAARGAGGQPGQPRLPLLRAARLRQDHLRPDPGPRAQLRAGAGRRPVRRVRLVPRPRPRRPGLAST